MIDGEGTSQVLNLDVRSGALDRLHGETVALGAERARTAHIRVGDRVPLALGDGTRVRLRSSPLTTVRSASATSCCLATSRRRTQRIRYLSPC